MKKFSAVIRHSVFFSLPIIIIVFQIILSSDLYSQNPVSAKNGMVVTVSSPASMVGLEILKQGGSAVDAAVATGFALAVTYPYAGNIGGGGFMVIRLSDGRNISIDFREKAPLRASRDMYLDEDGNFVDSLSMTGGTSVGVPGSVAGLIYALEKYGTMPLDKIIEPAINLAENGWIIDKRSAESFRKTLPKFKKFPSSFKVFSKNGKPYKEGDIFIQKDLANTLKLIQRRGRDGFYKGSTARRLIEQIRKNCGIISQKDLDNYRPAEREPVTGTYRGYKIISMPPPSSGGILLIEMLNVLENFDFSPEEWGSGKYYRKLIETMKYAYADRSVHLGDPDFYPVPQNGLISKEYAKSIYEKVKAGVSPSVQIKAGNPNLYKESAETTHYSIYDKYGNAVSVTTTLNSGFGNKIIVEGAGFLLNNEMDDFSAKPGVPNQFGLVGGEGNSIAPGKRMLSSMTPTIVLKNDKPYIIIGSPGGSTIITTVLQVIINVIDFHMNIQRAIDMPRIHHQWLPDKIYFEKHSINLDTAEKLKAFGYRFNNLKTGFRTLGRAKGILIDRENETVYGACDPRSGGLAAGY